MPPGLNADSQKEVAACLLRNAKQDIEALIEKAGTPSLPPQAFLQRLLAIEKKLRQLRQLQESELV